VTIGGHVWTIRCHWEPWDRKEVGRCLGPPERKIDVLSSIDNAVANRDTLYHELLHALEYELRVKVPHNYISKAARLLARMY